MSTENCTNNEREKEEVINYSRLARDGISLMLNNKQNEAEILFKSYPQSIQMNAGYAFAVFTDALMSFEDEKLQLALQLLKDLEKKCSSNTGWIRSMRCKMFGTGTNSDADQLESQIILADSLVFVATLTFLQQDITGYFKGGWILRKAFKHYQHAYNEILDLYKEIVGEENVPFQKSEIKIPSCQVVTPENKDIVEFAAQSVQNFPSQDVVSTHSPTESPPNSEESVLVNAHAGTPVLECSTDVLQTGNEKSAISMQSRNGYIHTSNIKKPFPKHSISCHENLGTQSSGKAPLKNGYVKGRCRGHARSAGTQIRPFLKKSESVHSALSDSGERRSSFASNFSLSYFTSTFNIFSNRPNPNNIDKQTISRLLCAACFGYGLLQLGISLLPPSMLKLSNFLGLGGNRKNGLDNLMFSRNGTDMRAPFATLALLWYHTIVRPFFALDGNNVQAGVEIAAQLIDESKNEYGESALFLFFEGRVQRLNSDIPAAIKAFQTSIDNSAQREIKMMSLHEVGWCYLIQLNYPMSEGTFTCLKQSSRWSRSFYSYLSIISAGSNHMFQDSSDVRELRNIFLPVVKGTQLDEFLNRRYKLIPVDADILKQLSCLFWKLLVYELLYLWNALPSCTNESLDAIIGDCEAAVDLGCEPMPGLADLIEGSCFCILRRMNDGVEMFRSCLEKRRNLPSNCSSAHISAFAHYELGLLLIRNEETLSEGKRLLQLAAYSYRDYDFEQRLSVRVHTVLKNL